VSADGSAASAEMTQVQRMARLMPPLCNSGLLLHCLLQNSLFQSPAKTKSRTDFRARFDISIKIILEQKFITSKAVWFEFSNLWG
jgi:hypothetical protein